jgi:O2-independent ubiquinone biosynthesis protein UbiU
MSMQSHLDGRPPRRIEVVCGVCTLPALRAAADSGAFRVSFGMNDPRSAQQHPLRLSAGEAARGIRYAHARGLKTLFTLDTYAQDASIESCRTLIDAAADLGADAVALSDLSLLEYASCMYPSLPLYLSARAGASNHETLAFYEKHFAVKRALLPVTLSIDEVEHIAANTTMELEMHVFGDPCVMTEGQCALSSYVTNSARSTAGVCTPTSAIHWTPSAEGLECRVNDVLVDRLGRCEHAAHPTPCSGRYDVGGRTYHPFEQAIRFDTLELMPAIARLGLAAVRIEARRGDVPHLSEVTRIWRDAADMCHNDPTRFGWVSDLALVLRRLREGRLQPPSEPYTRGR